MMQHEDSRALRWLVLPARMLWHWRLVLVPIAILLLVELALTGADLRLWGSPLWRPWSFVNLSFRPGLLAGGSILWPGQAAAMFVTHVFVHVGPVHMLGNLLSLALLMRLLQRLPPRHFLWIGALSALGGAAFFALVVPPNSSMTGASGAISGLAAYWAVRRLRHSPLRWKAIVAGLLLLAVLAGLEQLPGIATAWQAHLGGALVGAVMALWPSKRRLSAP